MTFLAPWWLAGSGAMALLVVALHLLARRRPRVLMFPTARFIPDRPATAAAFATRPVDLLLLLLRVLIVLLLGAAFARPILSSAGRTLSIVLHDQSRLAPPLDSSTAALIRSADVVIAFDTSARLLRSAAVADSPGGSGASGSISAALLAGLRAASSLGTAGDSLALTIISPFAQEEFDRATLRIRRLWQGHIDLVPVPARLPAISQERLTLPPDDPLSATLRLLYPDGRIPTRLVRGRPSPADSVWAKEGGALVVWPRAPAEVDWEPGPGDTAGGLAVQDRAVVAPFTRDFQPPAGKSVAVWPDGSAAATVAPLGKGCVRNVAVAVPRIGDLVLRPGFRLLTRALLSPCAGEIESERVSPQLLDSLRGRSSLLARASLSNPPTRRTPAHSWLLLGAAVLFVIEPLLRRTEVPQ